MTELRDEIRRGEDRSTHDMVLDLDRKVTEHIEAEPAVMAAAVDSAVNRAIFLLVPNEDPEGHKKYHQKLIETAEAQRKAAEEQAEFWRNARKELVRAIVQGGARTLAKAFWLAVVLGLAAWLGWPKVEKWWGML